MKRSMKKSSEFQTFSDALKAVLSVPREEMKRREEEYQSDRGQKKREAHPKKGSKKA